MRHSIAVALFAGAWLVAVQAAAAGPAKVQGRVERDGQSYALTRAVAWQAARPDALVVVLTDAEVAPMDVRHPFRLKRLAEDGKVHGVRFEFDPAHLDPKYVYGKFMLPGWNTYSGLMGAAWEKLEVANGRIAGKIDSGGVQLDFDLPIVGATGVKTLTGAEAQHSPQADTLIAYEDAVRKGSWKEASKSLTPISAEILQREVATPEGLGQFQTAGKYMKQLLPQGDARRAQIEKVVVGGDDAAVIGNGFAADFVLVNGRWLKI